MRRRATSHCHTGSPSYGWCGRGGEHGWRVNEGSRKPFCTRGSRPATTSLFCLLLQHGRIRRGCPRARTARARRGPAGSARGPESLLHSSRRAAGQRARSTHVASTIQPTVLSILLGNSTRFLDIQNNRIRLLSYRIRRPGCRSSTLGMNDGMKLYEAALAALGHFTQPAQPNRSLVILRDPIIHTMAGTARGRFRRARITRVMPMMW